MANTKVLMFYVFFLIIISTMFGLVGIDNDGFSIEKYLVVSKLRNDLEENRNFVSSVISIVLVPFLVINYMIALLILVGFGFTQIPAVLNILIFTPLGLWIVFDYIIPIIRGN